jgi:hypothetical protein
MLELMSQVWVELVCYAAARCSPDSHARQLSNGEEFTTVVAFLIEYTKSPTMCSSIDMQGDTLEESLAKSTIEAGIEDV